jgi:hypothetical protein
LATRPLVYYISGHGFGHASRAIEVVNALLARRPDLPIAVRTGAPQWLFDLTVRGRVEYARIDPDPGIVQVDSLRLDEAETVRRAVSYVQGLPARARDEADLLRACDAAFVVADIPPLGLAAAAAAGVPAVAIGNFTWDWIYDAYPGGREAAGPIREVYRRARRALRLPMWGGFDAFDEIEDLPFIARHARRAPADTRRLLGLPETRVALVSFGGYGVEGVDLEALGRVPGWTLLVSGSVPFGPSRRPLSEAGRQGSLFPLDEPAMYAQGLRYEDVVRAVDVVVTKPGYGIIAECLANDTAVLYTDRGHFIEYDVLVAAMPALLRCAYLPQAEVLAGAWGPALDAVLARPAPPTRPATNGAEVAADRILALMGSSSSQRSFDADAP